MTHKTTRIRVEADGASKAMFALTIDAQARLYALERLDTQSGTTMTTDVVRGKVGSLWARALTICTYDEFIKAARDCAYRDVVVEE